MACVICHNTLRARNSSFKICIEWNFQLSKTSKPWLACFMPYAKQHNENMMHTKTADIFCKTAKKFCAKSTNFSFEKLIFVSILELDFIFSLVWLAIISEGRRHLPSGMKLQWFTAHESCLALQKSSSFEQLKPHELCFTWVFRLHI